MCPRDGGLIRIERVHFPGVRVVMTGWCETCSHRLLQDLPTGYGGLYPATFDLESGDAWGRWFPDLLIDGWAKPDRAPVAIETHGLATAQDVVLLPALDFVYGHALMALLNAQRHIDAGERVVALVPRALAHLVPPTVAETWIVDAPLSRFRGWLADLDQRIVTELGRFRQVTLSPASPRPHPSTWDLSRFIGELEEDRVGDPSIAFVWRNDRLWGGRPDGQIQRFEDTLALIAQRLPNVGGTLIGVGPRAADVTDSQLRDLRSDRPGDRAERRWLEVLKGSDLAIGVHGSNMLLPSGLAGATIELLPEDRFANFGDASLISDSDPAHVLFRHRTIPGRADLSDVTPARVAAMSVALLGSSADFRNSVLGAGSGLISSPWPSPGDAPRWHRELPDEQLGKFARLLALRVRG